MLGRAPDEGTRMSVSLGERVRSVSAGSRDLLNVELDHAIALIAAAGEHAPCGHHWPILRKRGRGCAVATLGFTLARESKLLLTHRGRSSANAKSTGRDLPTGFAVGRIHNRCSILRDRDTGVERPGGWREPPCPGIEWSFVIVSGVQTRGSASGANGTSGVEVSHAQQVNRTRTVPLISVGLAWSGTT